MWIFDNNGNYRNDQLPAPFRQGLDTGLQAGETIIVRGKNGTRFDINLTTDPSATVDCPFHLSVRMEEKAFVMNSNQGGTWGKEERKKCNLTQEGTFDIRIRCQQDRFQVFSDYEKIGEFEYRKPLAEVKSIFIDGGVSLYLVQRSGTYYSMPYQEDFRGEKVAVSGQSTGNRFSVNFLTAQGNIAYHASVRYDEKAIVRNTKLSGEWGTEEREGELNLTKNRVFDILINNNNGWIELFTNGTKFATFKNRMHEKVSAVSVEGDVELHQVLIK